MALAQFAGQTVAGAAITDVWEAVRGRFARLLGRGDTRKTQVAEQWLAQTQKQLTAAAGSGREQVQQAQAQLGDPVAVGAAIIALRRYSLVAPAGDGLVLVHRLVQAITRAQLTADQAVQWEQTTAALVEGAVPTDPKLPAAWPVSAVLLPHARTILDLTSDGVWQITQSLGHSGSYTTARDLFRLIANAHKQSDAYGPEV